MARERLLRALSIRQPHSENILRGTKVKEYRGRRTHIRGRVYLYAGKKFDLDVEGISNKEGALLRRGAIVGSVEIVDCRESKKYPGYFEWKLAKPRRYRSPIEPRGFPQPGFWHPKF